MFEQAISKIKGNLESNIEKLDNVKVHNETAHDFEVKVVLPQKTQFSTSRQNEGFIDYDHLITLLSTPLSLLITALTTRRASHLCIPCNTATLLKEISEALGLSLQPFNLGKYVFQHSEEC